MRLPIDARMAPFKEKYLDEETFLLARWFTMGTSLDGTVWLHSKDDDIFCGLTTEQATRLIKARQVFIDEIIATLNNEVNR